MNNEMFLTRLNDVINLILNRKSVQVPASKKYIEFNTYYWSVCILKLIEKDLTESTSDRLFTLALACINSDGGFGVSKSPESQISVTLCALQIVSLLRREFSTELQLKIMSYAQAVLQHETLLQNNGMRTLGIQNLYSALYCLKVTDGLIGIDRNATKNALLKTLNWDGGVGAGFCDESHAAQAFCCLASLDILGTIDSISARARERLALWLADCQCSDGGFCGRPNKKSDSCYSWWINASLQLLRKDRWIDTPNAEDFVWSCVSHESPGFSDKPGNNPDPYHTFFGFMGLALLHDEAHKKEKNGVELSKISCTYALPLEIANCFSSASETWNLI